MSFGQANPGYPSSSVIFLSPSMLDYTHTNASSCFHSLGNSIFIPLMMPSNWEGGAQLGAEWEKGLPSPCSGRQTHTEPHAHNLGWSPLLNRLRNRDFYSEEPPLDDTAPT